MIEKDLFFRKEFFFGDPQAFVRPFPIDQICREARDRIAQEGVEAGAKPGINPAFQM